MAYAVLLPERFRGCCPFGATNFVLGIGGLSRAAVPASPRLLPHERDLWFLSDLMASHFIESALIPH